MNNAELHRVRVSAAVLRPGDELLTVRELQLAIPVVNLPGGVPQIGETLKQALVREVREETGYDVLPTEIAFVAEQRSDRWSPSLFEICFYAEIVSSTRHHPAPGDSVYAVEWLKLDDPDVLRHLPHAQLFAATKRGRYIEAPPLKRGMVK